MELRQVRYFVVLADELHFGRAATRLQLAQPALSQQIHNLEAELGVKLFNRTKRHVELTDAGKHVLGEAQALLAQAEQVRHTATRAARGQLGRLQIGCTATTLYNVVPELLRHFRLRYPEAEVVVTECCTADQIELLNRQQIHIGILHPPLYNADLACEVIYCEPMLLALPSDHALAQHEHIHIASLKEQPLILFPRSAGPTLYDTITVLCQQAGFSPSVVQEVSAPQTVLGLVAAGVGCAFVAHSLQQMQQPGVVFRAVQESQITLETALAWRPAFPSPLIEAFP